MQEELTKNGFHGFISIQELMNNSNVIPAEIGVYIVLRKSTDQPHFLSIGTGGFFKGKNPNVAIETLREKWVNDSQIMYIGKAGNMEKTRENSKKATLKSRLRQYLKFGQGEPVGHQGGRYIWQLADSRSLLICWKELPNHDPREIEKLMIQDFKKKHNGKRPFANLQD